MKKLLSLIPAAVLLAACGSGGGDDPGAAAVSAPSAPSAPSVPHSGAVPADSFMDRMNGVVGVTAETTEPDPLDNAPASTREDTEPWPVS